MFFKTSHDSDYALVIIRSHEVFFKTSHELFFKTSHGSDYALVIIRSHEVFFKTSHEP